MESISLPDSKDSSYQWTFGQFKCRQCSRWHFGEQLSRTHLRHSVTLPSPPLQMLSESVGAYNGLFPLILLLLLAVPAPAQSVDENYLTRADVRAGQLFPGNVSTSVGETIFVRVVKAVDDQAECTFRRPGGQDVSVFAAPSSADE